MNIMAVQGLQHQVDQLNKKLEQKKMIRDYSTNQ
jgi:hypothetical protein